MRQPPENVIKIPIRDSLNSDAEEPSAKQSNSSWLAGSKLFGNACMVPFEVQRGCRVMMPRWSCRGDMVL